MKTRKRTLLFAALLVLLATALAFSVPFPRATQAQGSIIFDGSPGTGAPPPTLGPYTMTPFAADGRALGVDVTDVPGPTGDLLFDRNMNHRRIGSGWATWSHGYTGDVYVEDGTSDQVVMMLPPDTGAFYFYAEPNAFASYNVTATAQDGTTSGPISVQGNSGAQYFGFYSTGGAPLLSITVDVDPAAGGFAVGEFGIAQHKPVGGVTVPVSPLVLLWPWVALAAAVGLGSVGVTAALRKRSAVESLNR
jgi:hypothetical protein